MIYKKIMRTLSIIIFFELLIIGSTVKFSNPFERRTISEGTKKENDSKGTKASKKQKKIEKVMPNIDDAITILLSEGDSMFFANYPVDDGFLGWIADLYGENALYDLAYFSQQGNFVTDKWFEVTGKSVHVLWADYCKDIKLYTYLEDDIHWVDKENPDADIIMDFVGDINFDSNWHTMKAAKDRENGIEDCFSNDLLNELQSADVTLVNNEFTYGENGKALENKDYVFRAKPSTADYLELLGTDIVSLANNHVFDYGEKGLMNTLDTLEKAGIETVGAGKNIKDAAACKYYIVNGRKIGILAATQIEKFSHFTQPATETNAGVFKTLDNEYLQQRISEEKQKCDYLIVVIHWGNEGTEFFEPDQTHMASVMAEAGADAIIGGHPHRLQGCSFVNGVPVAYSIGNFWFSTGSLYTTVSQVRIDKDGELSLSVLPCVQEDMKTSLITEKEKVDSFYHYVADISNFIGIDSNGRIYDLSEMTDLTKWKEFFEYRTDQNYGSHHSEYDINGNRIDRVGNLE